MKLPFKKEEFLGNIRSGNRRENNLPRNLNYFDVHLDNYTSEFSIELFAGSCKEKPTQLKIQPIDNIFITYEIYTKELKCRGENRKATRIQNNGEKQQGKCKEEECEYCKSGKCNRVGRLYFKLAGIEDKGIWCYTTRSRGIEYIERYLNLMKEQKIDISKNYFLLSLNEKHGKSGKVYVPDIKLIRETMNQSSQQKSNKTGKKEEDNKISKFYKYIKGKMIDHDGQRIPELTFSRNGVEKAVYLTKESKKDILKLKPGTVIAMTKISKEKNNMIFLKDYNIIEAVTQQNKKAV